MRRVSKKRAKLNALAKVFRDRLRAEIGRCEYCGKGKPQLHEITQGYGRRVLALMDRSLIVGLCQECHRLIHTQGARGRATCLALICLRRPDDYDLEHYWAVEGRRLPSADDVSEAFAGLL